MDTMDNSPLKQNAKSLWPGPRPFIMTPLMMMTLTSSIVRPWPRWLSGPKNTLTPT
jgi:hypothetical protein